MPQLHIDISCPSPTVVRVVVVGDVDLSSAAVLRDGLLRVLHDRDPAVVEVDLAGVAFLDCTGIGALAAVYHTAVRSGRRLRVTDPQPIVRKVLELTGLLGVLTAPIDGREPLPPESGDRSSAAVSIAQPPDAMVAG
jgi:anti-anti-sigma factor